MYAKPGVLHTSSFKSPDMYAKPGVLHTSPSKSPDLYAKCQPLHTQGLATGDSAGFLQQPDIPAGDQIAVQYEEDFQGLAAGGIGHVIAAQALVLEYELVLTEFQSRITD